MEEAEYIAQLSQHSYLAAVNDVQEEEEILEIDPRFYDYLRQKYEDIGRRPRVASTDSGISLARGVPMDLRSADREIAGVNIPYDAKLFDEVEEGMHRAPDAVWIRFDDGRLGRGNDPEFDYEEKEVTEAMDELAEDILGSEKGSGLGAR